MGNVRAGPPGISAAVVAGLLLLATGCYSYSATEIGGVEPGTEVRATLTTEKSLDLEERLGARRDMLEGEVIDADGRSILLGVTWDVQEPRLGSEILQQRIRLQEPDVLEVETRTLDRLRTGGFVGAVAAGATFLVIQLITGDDPGGTPTPPPNNGQV